MATVSIQRSTMWMAISLQEKDPALPTPISVRMLWEVWVRQSLIKGPKFWRHLKCKTAI